MLSSRGPAIQLLPSISMMHSVRGNQLSCVLKEKVPACGAFSLLDQWIGVVNLGLYTSEMSIRQLSFAKGAITLMFVIFQGAIIVARGLFWVRRREIFPMDQGLEF